MTYPYGFALRCKVCHEPVWEGLVFGQCHDCIEWADSQRPRLLPIGAVVFDTSRVSVPKDWLPK